MKKLILLYISGCFLLAAAVSCKKDISPEGTAALTVINAIPDCPVAAMNFTGNEIIYWYSTMNVNYATYAPSFHMTVSSSKELPVAFKKFPDTTVNDKYIYKTVLHPANGEVSTLFLVGTLANPESMLVTKTPPHYSSTDSVMGLRVVNLSPGSAPVKVNISGQDVNVTSNNLVYKGITDYLPLKATSKVGNLLVQFYDQASGTLLASYTLPNVGATATDNPWRYRNYTIALKGLPNAANASETQGAFVINDY